LLVRFHFIKLILVFGNLGLNLLNLSLKLAPVFLARSEVKFAVFVSLKVILELAFEELDLSGQIVDLGGQLRDLLIDVLEVDNRFQIRMHWVPVISIMSQTHGGGKKRDRPICNH